LAYICDTALEGYAKLRDRPDMEQTSRLSPHLHWGDISPRQVWHAIEHAAAGNPKLASGREKYLKELLWREFAYHLLYHQPQMPSQPLDKRFATFPWQPDAGLLRAWQRGQTGFPIVDAGMRQLWQTGWMHNRVRMICASLLVKHLLQPWQDGAAWFWDTLVDADLASNSASWQWVAGCGADAAPYYRIFNPILQGEKFDPNGDYVRQYVPELRDVSKEYIHKPWESGLHLAYPAPIVDHATGRGRALAALAEMGGSTFKDEESKEAK
jgi:deoxyribodipyrimidine photo-lyase